MSKTEQVSRHSAVSAETMDGAEAHPVSSEAELCILWMELSAQSPQSMAIYAAQRIATRAVKLAQSTVVQIAN